MTTGWRLLLYRELLAWSVMISVLSHTSEMTIPKPKCAAWPITVSCVKMKGPLLIVDLVNNALGYREIMVSINNKAFISP